MGTCGASANRDDWNTWIAAFKTCPWCGMAGNPFPSHYGGGGGSWGGGY